MSNKKTIYFQPPGIKPNYYEVGVIEDEYIYYRDEPCKILLSEVRVLSEEEMQKMHTPLNK